MQTWGMTEGIMPEPQLFCCEVPQVCLMKKHPLLTSGQPTVWAISKGSPPWTRKQGKSQVDWFFKPKLQEKAKHLTISITKNYCWNQYFFPQPFKCLRKMCCLFPGLGSTHSPRTVYPENKWAWVPAVWANTWASRSEMPGAFFLWHSLHPTLCHEGRLGTLSKVEWETFPTGQCHSASSHSALRVHASSSHSKQSIPSVGVCVESGNTACSKPGGKTLGSVACCGALGPGRRAPVSETQQTQGWLPAWVTGPRSGFRKSWVQNRLSSRAIYWPLQIP